MKLLTAVAPAVLIVVLMGCSTNYGSNWEAKRACADWRSEGVETGKIDVTIIGNRYCEQDEETNQMLGIESVQIIKGGFHGSKYEVVKNFRY